MNFKLLGVSVSLRYPFLAVLTVFLALDQTGLAGQMLCAALLHELGHLTVMYLLHQPPQSIVFLPFGIRIQKQRSTAISYGKELLIFLAGPLCNLLAAAVLWKKGGGEMPVLAQIHLLLGLFNLLPIGALDGGMIVQNLSQCFALPDRARHICRAVSLAALLPIAAGAVLLTLRGEKNITLIVTCCYLAVSIFSRKGE